MGSGVEKAGWHTAMDREQHVETYHHVLHWTKIGIVFLVLLLAGMLVSLV